MKTSPSDQTLLQLAAADLACFGIAVHPGFELARHTRLLIELLEEIDKAQGGVMGAVRRLLTGKTRLLISEPPRHGKTLLISQLFPAWFLGRHPDRSVILASYGQDLSDDIGRRVRNLMADPLYEAIFPHTRLSGDSTSLRRFDTTAGGSFYAVGRGGPITGRGAHLLIWDDLLKDVEEARSETIRRGLHDWCQQVAYTRLTPDGAVVGVGTRWHEDDLTGWLLREHAAEGWRLLNLPALAEANDPLGRAEGDALWPARFDREALESIRRQIGSAAFTSLYQGHPSAASGTVFKREWFRTYREPLPSFQKTIQSWDTAYGKSTSSGDYSVCTTWGTNNNGHYLLALWRGRVDFPKLKYQVRTQAEQWKPHAVLVEDTASGQSLLQELKLATNYPVIAVRADRDKRSRAEAVTPMFESGRVFLPADAPWLNDFADELASFPNGVHDDMVDSTTQALNYLRQGAYTEPPPFLIVERPGPLAELRAALSRPSARAMQDPRGFYEPRPILPGVGHQLTGEAAEASRRIAEGNSRPDDIDKVMWGGFEDF
jgi:predicted phage terminase large subunit-like protein